MDESHYQSNKKPASNRLQMRSGYNGQEQVRKLMAENKMMPIFMEAALDALFYRCRLGKKRATVCPGVSSKGRTFYIAPAFEEGRARANRQCKGIYMAGE